MGKTPSSHIIHSLGGEYLTIIPRARMGSESASWAIDSEAMRERGIIVLVKSNWLVKNIDNRKLLAS